jgi:hypothetical protein
MSPSSPSRRALRNLRLESSSISRSICCMGVSVSRPSASSSLRIRASMAFREGTVRLGAEFRFHSPPTSRKGSLSAAQKRRSVNFRFRRRAAMPGHCPVADKGEDNQRAGIGWRRIGITPVVGWARPDSNRRSSLCESDVVTTGPRARRRGRGFGPHKPFSHAKSNRAGRRRLAATVSTSPVANARLPASGSPYRVTK